MTQLEFLFALLMLQIGLAAFVVTSIGVLVSCIMLVIQLVG